MTIIPLKSGLTYLRLLKNASVAATANTTGVDIHLYVGHIVVNVDIGDSTAGTNPTLDVKLQTSPDNSTWTDLSGQAITQATAATTQQLVVDTRATAGKYLRAALTIGGTSSPAFPCSIMTIGQLQVQ